MYGTFIKWPICFFISANLAENERTERYREERWTENDGGITQNTTDSAAAQV